MFIHVSHRLQLYNLVVLRQNSWSSMGLEQQYPRTSTSVRFDWTLLQVRLVHSKWNGHRGGCWKPHVTWSFDHISSIVSRFFICFTSYKLVSHMIKFTVSHVIIYIVDISRLWCYNHYFTYIYIYIISYNDYTTYTTIVSFLFMLGCRHNPGGAVPRRWVQLLQGPGAQAACAIDRRPGGLRGISQHGEFYGKSHENPMNIPWTSHENLDDLLVYNEESHENLDDLLVYI